MARFLLPALIIALASMAAAANEVYRTVDRDGTVIYSDRPLSPSSQLVGVVSQPTDPERVAAEAEARRTAEAARRQPAAEPDSLDAARAEQEELLAEACREARQAKEAYERAPRLYEELPDGGRRFLSDEELIQARQSARQAVIDFCDD
jgi:hypothetical protein